jgi:hypothetical protein
MSWITDLFTEVGRYGSEFIRPENLAKSLGTAGVMSLFGGNSDDFARNFLLSNLGRTIDGTSKGSSSKPTPKNLLQQYNKLTPAQQQQYKDNFNSGNLSEKQFNDYKNIFGGQSKSSYEDYVQVYGNKPALSGPPSMNPDPFNQNQDGYGGSFQNASFSPANQTKISGGSEVAEVTNYDPSGLFGSSAPTTGIASVQQQGPMGTEFTTEKVPGGTILTNPSTGLTIFSETGTGAKTVLTKASKKAPGFGEGIGYFTDRLGGGAYDKTMFSKLIAEAINPDYYKKRDFQQEAEDRDKRLRNQFRQETLNPARSGFSRNMRARRYASGGIADLQSGGAANGPGTGTSDSIPARLSDGEFVMTAEAVRNMGNGSREKGTRKMYDLMNNLERRM